MDKFSRRMSLAKHGLEHTTFCMSQSYRVVGSFSFHLAKRKMTCYWR